MVASAYRSEVGWKEPYEPQNSSPRSEPGTTAAAATAAVSGRPLSVEERQAKAKQDIAAAKAREAAFAGQGTRQFTDTNIAQPETPDFGSYGSLGGSATDTFELRDGEAQSEDENPTGTFVLSPDARDVSSGSSQQSAEVDSKQDEGAKAQAELQGLSRQIRSFSPDQSAASRAADARSAPVYEPDNGKPSYSEAAGDTEAATAAAPADDDRSSPVNEADSSKPVYAKGRSELKPRPDDQRNAREQPQAELQGQSLRQSAAGTADDTEADTADDTEADTAADTADRPGQDATAADDDIPAPVYAKGRSELKPRADDQRDAREQPQADLQRQSLGQPAADTADDTQPDTAAETADRQAKGATAATEDTSAPEYEADTNKPVNTKGRSELKPRPDDQRDAREQPLADLRRQSLGQPAAGTADDTAAETADRPAKGATAANEDPPAPEDEADTSKPQYVQGRSDLKLHADGSDAGAKAQAELQKQQTPAARQPADTAADNMTAVDSDTAADTDTAAEPTDNDRPAPVYEPDTSKPLYTKGRSDLKPHADDEHNAREKAQAELRQKSRQTFTPAVSAAEAVKQMKAEEKPQSDSPSAAATSAASDQSGPVAKPIVGGRAPAGEHEAREKAMAELKKKSQEQQPVTGVSSGEAKAIPKPRAQDQSQNQPLASEQKPLSVRNQTQDLAEGLAGASMSAKPTKAKAKGQISPSGKRQPSPFQAQQAASSMSTTDSTAASLSPASQPQNPFQNLVSAFQGLFGGQASSSPQLRSSFAPDQPATDLSSSSNLSTAQQAQITPADASAAQRMAASNQALAANKGQAGVRTEVPVKRYTKVTPDGNVTEFVRERGLRAPLLLLAGIAASAAQTLEPLWPVSLLSRAFLPMVLWKGTATFTVFCLYGCAASSLSTSSASVDVSRELVCRARCWVTSNNCHSASNTLLCAQDA